VDNCWPFALFSLATHGAFIPYDGGADVFVPAPRLVAPLKALFKEWLSRTPSGL
jgi:hypothetical protein